MMMRSSANRLLAILAVMAAFASVGVCGAPRDREAPDAAAAAAGGNAFAVDLYARLKAEEGNIFFSPYSLSTALAMTYAGAAGNTAAEMARVLHFTLPPERLHPAFARLIKDVESAGDAKGCELRIANALWGQDGFVFRKEFLQLVETNYGAPLEQVDFAHAAEAARARINDWVAEQTRDKIKDLIPPGVLGALTRLVLTNAVYFKGDWEHPFEKSATSEAPFWITRDRSVSAPMMQQTGSFRYGETELCQALELPYAGDALAMFVLLPRDRDGLPRLEGALTPEALSQWTTALRSREVAVTMPKFKLACQFSLADVLEKMGMSDAFSTNADFSGMTGRRDLQVSAVIHKAFVDVNEEGTEAAAATGVVMTLTAMPAPPVAFRADHPFLLLIQHKPSGSILFMGRVADPVGEGQAAG
jgi:serpin B